MSIRDRVRSKGVMSGLRRYPKRGWVAGVCAGLADYFGWNVRVLRVIFALGLFFSGFFPVGFVYALLWYVMAPAYDGRVADDTPHDYASYQEQRHERRMHRAEAYASASATDVKSRFSTLEQRLRSMEECVSSKDFELRRELKKLEG
jgi:phage shock protein C